MVLIWSMLVAPLLWHHNTSQENLFTLRSDYQRLALIPLQTPTVDTTYCDVVFIVRLKPCQFTLCNTGITDVQKSSIWGIRIIGGNVDEVDISTVSTTQCPAHSDTHNSIGILREVNTGEDQGWDGTSRKEFYTKNECSLTAVISCGHCQLNTVTWQLKVH